MKVLISICRSGVVLGTALLMAGQVLAADLSNLPQPLRTETIPDKPDDAHWAWITDINNTQYAPARLFDMDTKKLLGHVELGFEGNSVTVPSIGKNIYMAGYYYSRGYHGERADVVEIIDKNTLEILEEIEVAPKLISRLAKHDHHDVDRGRQVHAGAVFYPGVQHRHNRPRSQKICWRICNSRVLELTGCWTAPGGHHLR